MHLKISNVMKQTKKDEELQLRKNFLISATKSGLLVLAFTVLGLPFLISCGDDDDSVVDKKGMIIGEKTVISEPVVSDSSTVDSDNLFVEQVTEGELIDLGLSVRWASCNIGASKPEECGDYVCWGDPTGSIEWNSTTASQQYVNLASICSTQYDYASIKSNGELRMPTKAEMQELLDKCTWAYMPFKGINGFRIIGPNNNSIFLPMAGSRDPYKNNVTGRWKYDRISGKSSVAHYHTGEQHNQITAYGLRMVVGITDSPYLVLSHNRNYEAIAPWAKYTGLTIRPVSNLSKKIMR